MDQAGLWSATQSRAVTRAPSGRPRERKNQVFAHRAPLVLLWFDGVLLLRFEESRFDALLLKLPPRITRLEETARSTSVRALGAS